MSFDALNSFRCPACGAAFSVRDNATLVCTDGHTYTASDGFFDLIHPRELLPSDAEFRSKYDTGAKRYDDGLAWLFQSFGEDEDAFRARLADLLGARDGSVVLEIGSGTGKDSLEIARRVGPSGHVVVTDLSQGMLAIARTRIGAQAHASYALCNGAYLPFADHTFDAVFHFGGINEFGDKARAIGEMFRVARPGAKVVFGDEGLPPWLRETTFGKLLSNANPLYLHEPPLAALPESAREVGIRWMLGSAFYVIEARAGSGPPFVDADLPIPGKWDTLRERLERSRSSKP